MDMLQTNERKKLRGMTLVEIIAALVIIVLVTSMAYAGVSASANMVVHGTDLRNADGPLVSMIESEIRTYSRDNPPSTVITEYNVQINRKVTDVNENPVTDSSGCEITEQINNYNQSVALGSVAAVSGDIRYVMYFPCITTPPPPETVPEVPEGPVPEEGGEP